MNIPLPFESSFDSLAEEYDTFRPSYPEALVETVLAYSKIPKDGTILEIGCGTGQATRPFGTRGYRITGVEPGKNLLTLAAKNCCELPNVTFVNSTFEAWNSEQKGFDLIIAGQSFHWIQEDVRYEKSHQLLKEDGALALFWNALKEDTEFSRAENELWVKYLGESARGTNSEEYAKSVELELGCLRSAPSFKDATLFEIPHWVTYSAQEYVGLQGTYSANTRLEPALRAALFEDISTLIASFGGSITVPYMALLFIARAKN